jgi:hypothetical protein
MTITQLSADPMMTHLMSALNRAEDIGHYGRLVFVLGARHVMSDGELIYWLTKDRDCTEQKARLLVDQVKTRNYNPPKRERILEWMQKQEFPICPEPDNPSACNLYRNVEFPHEVYEKIQEFRGTQDDGQRGR